MCMKRSSKRTAAGMLTLAARSCRSAARAVVAILLGIGSLSLHAQDLGQQVSPAPVGSQQSGSPGAASGLPTLSGYGQSQAPSAPLNVPPGTGPITNNTGVLGTGADIPQASPNAQIEPGDLLDVVVFETPELSGRFR